MDPINYQKLAARSLSNKPEHLLTEEEQLLAMCALGLTGEAGEVAEIIKKALFHGHPIDVNELKKELGDVLWYTAALCTKFGIEMNDVMDLNIEKLNKRYPEGFNSFDSINRKEM